MIRGWAVVLGLAITTFIADGKGAAQPLRSNHECPVPADPSWTAQEIFVWNHVCVGVDADFTSESGYGGAIDPQQSAGFPNNRVLTSVFIETVLLDEKYRRALTRLGVVIVGARFTEPIDLADANLGYDLALRDSLLENGANFRGLRSKHRVSLRGSKIVGKLDMAELHAEQVDLSKSWVTGDLIMNYIEARDGLFMDNGEFNNVELRTSRIGKEFDLTKSRIAGRLNMERMVATGGVFLGEGAEVEGPIYFVSGNCDSLELPGGTFHQDFDLTGTRITNALVLRSSHGPTRWAGNPLLILRNVTADTIQDSPESWPLKLDLVGFTYRTFGGVDERGSGTSTDRNVGWFVDWLGKSNYSPQPYEQLAQVLRIQGGPGDADRILYAGRERTRLNSSGLDYLWQSTLKFVIGYGYHVWQAVLWLGGLWIFGAFVQWTRPRAKDSSIGELLVYSFEMLLPVFRLRGQTREFHSRPQDIWFHIQGLLGVIFTAFLAAGLAGLTK
jgi:hypothetical protein